jgi:hypothetical protein
LPLLFGRNIRAPEKNDCSPDLQHAPRGDTFHPSALISASTFFTSSARLTLALYAVFTDQVALDFYNDHPEHQKVAAIGRGISEKVVSVDFFSE